MRPTKALSLVALIAFASLPASAQVPMPAPPPAPYPYPYYPYVTVAPGVYFALSGGALLPNDVTVKSGGTIGGIAATSSGTASFKNGYVATGLIGFKPNPFVGLELEGGYTHFEIKNGSATVTLTGGATSSGLISGSANAILGFGNLIVYPFSSSAIFAPYLGAGGGGVAFQGSGTVGGLAFSTNGRVAEPAAAAIAGFDIGAPAGFKIGARYRYMWVGANNSHINTVTAQAITGVASLHF